MSVINVFQRLFDWLSLEDYVRADRAATVQTVKRYSRGNVSVQDGRYLTEDEMALRAASMSHQLPRLLSKYKSLDKN